MVVLRSVTTWEMDTFITVVSSTMMNCAAASIPATPHPVFASTPGARSVMCLSLLAGSSCVLG